MAFFFGTNPSIAAFLVALRLANLLRRIFGEGALLNSFIPHFESYRNENPKRAAEFFRDTFFSLILLLILFIGAIELAIHFWSVMFEITNENRQILHLIKIILPGVLFICLFSVCSGLLHCEKQFFITGISPVAYNFVWIVSVWLLRGSDPWKAANGLAVGVAVAFLCQWLITLPKTVGFIRKTLSWRELFKGRFFSEEIRNMFSSLTLGVIGVVAVQINTAVDTVFARAASLEGPAYLNYAIHLQQLPLALFGIGMSSALLPPLSRAFKSENMEQYNRLLEFSLSITLFIIIPCTVAIFVLGGASINLIFGRGAFDGQSILQTTLCLWGYGLGLIPMVITLLLAPAFYAKKDYRTPMAASLTSISVNVLFNFLMIYVFRLGPASLAVSTSIAAWCNAQMLYSQLSRKTGIALSSRFFQSLWKTIACGSAAGCIALVIGHVLLGDPTISILSGETVQFVRGFMDQIFQFLALSAVLGVTFFFLAWMLNHPEFVYLHRSRKSS